MTAHDEEMKKIAATAGEHEIELFLTFLKGAWFADLPGQTTHVQSLNREKGVQ